ncbi:MAG TPA: glutamyl-tRNA reductase [Candidatus Stackebrandtia faecavium]|nr:glutamyl-tRNA reductase [Candidatus Stackebrandtia faecavium]
MNLLVVGASHRTAPVDTLEQLSIPADEIPHLARRLIEGKYVDEVAVLSTCNRTEIYAAVSAFHGGLSQIAGELARHAGVDVEDISGHLYVRHDTKAVQHAFRVASGLDSLVTGEPQILGQMREAYQTAQQHGTVARLLHELLQTALRVGKRVHAETDIDDAAPNVVTAAFDLAEQQSTQGLRDADVLVIGAGAMGGLALSALRSREVKHVAIANRDAAKAQRLAESYGATPVAFDAVAEAARHADVIVTATGALSPIIEAHMLHGRREGLLICDLAVPRDVSVDAAALPGVTVIDLETLAQADGMGATEGYLAHANEILAEELNAFRNTIRAGAVAPTVAALRSRADDVVSAELSRLRRRTPSMPDETRAEVAHTVHRVVQELLHQPTVRVRQLAGEPCGDSYADALRELFALEGPELGAVDGNDTTEALRIAPLDTDDKAE